MSRNWCHWVWDRRKGRYVLNCRRRRRRRFPLSWHDRARLYGWGALSAYQIRNYYRNRRRRRRRPYRRWYRPRGPGRPSRGTRRSQRGHWSGFETWPTQERRELPPARYNTTDTGGRPRGNPFLDPIARLFTGRSQSSGLSYRD